MIMKSFTAKNWFKLSLIFIVLATIAGAFYWFGWRPSQIKKECANQALEIGGFTGAGSYDQKFERCLHEKGL